MYAGSPTWFVVPLQSVRVGALMLDAAVLLQNRGSLQVLLVPITWVRNIREQRVMSAIPSLP